MMLAFKTLEINGNLYFTEHWHNEISQNFAHIFNFKKQIITSNYRQTYYQMSLFVSGIVEASMDKIAMSIRLRVDI